MNISVVINIYEKQSGISRHILYTFHYEIISNTINRCDILFSAHLEQKVVLLDWHL